MYIYIYICNTYNISVYHYISVCMFVYIYIYYITTELSIFRWIFFTKAWIPWNTTGPWRAMACQAG